LFLATRVVDGVLLMIAARNQLPVDQLPRGSIVPVVRDPVTYFNVIQNWDGQWFRSIVEHGYPRTLPTEDGVVVQNQWAFYPLFPFLVRVVMTVTTLSFGAAAGLLNLVLASTGMCLLYRMITRRADAFAGAMTVIVLSTFPSGVVFQATYTESLTFLLVVVSLGLLERRRYGALLVSGLLLSVTRPVVLPLALTVGVHWLARWGARAAEPFPRSEQAKVGAVSAGLVASFAIWPIVAWATTGQSRAFLSSMDAWKSKDERASGWISWVSQSLSGHWVTLVLVVVGVSLQLFFLLRPQARLWSLELRTWSLSYGAYLLISTRPQSSFIRHLLIAIVPWWPFPEAGQHVISRRQQAALASLVAVLGFGVQYFWIRWFWVVSPHAVSFP
jgi:hypothetical protein